jgi:hypothetical protein
MRVVSGRAVGQLGLLVVPPDRADNELEKVLHDKLEQEYKAGRVSKATFEAVKSPSKG